MTRIGYICEPEPGETDRLIRGAAAQLEAAGLRLAGAIQSNPVRSDQSCCDMLLRLLPDGPELTISANRGRFARGCRLEPDVLEQAALAVERALPGAALLVINKFGKQEALGRGLAPALAMAAAQGLPVLMGVGRRNLEAFHAFAEGLAEPLEADIDAMTRWALAACGVSEAHHRATEAG